MINKSMIKEVQNRLKRWIIPVLLGTLLGACGQTKSSDFQTKPITYEKNNILEVKFAVDNGTFEYMAAVDQLRDEADSLLNEGPWSVTMKDIFPPGGTKHDYMSYGPYWWPDPENPGGPYIRRDGKRNEAILTPDKEYRWMMTNAVERLALAYILFDDARYAEHAVELMRTWYIDEETYMAPHLNYGQGIPNRTPGRQYGIIESRSFIKVLDAVNLLSDSDAYTREIHRGLVDWYDQFLQWLLTSELGKKEARSGNNHEVSYALQVTTFAIFVGKDSVALDQLSNHFKGRIIHMIEPDGRQPEELQRTKSLFYSVFNLEFMLKLCYLGEQYGLDLFNYTSPDGRSVKKALDFIAPALSGEKEWPYQEITRGIIGEHHQFYVLRMAHMQYEEPKYEEILKNNYGDLYPYELGQIKWPLQNENN
ncbi:MAG: alginate lyase family protein [Candidatus Marinimicrobia bacterium]|nr:alginate lyase family protein [Candidatus Neomarinimicrobiota bacterium]MCF7828915.1 alginate lyase family protein [Candidatus Neomarinimicrobiota bacterium]MCF7879875.1 alginate lyase family protein [Candidatus Neomarinimicrobiota bacterium]